MALVGQLDNRQRASDTNERRPLRPFISLLGQRSSWLPLRVCISDLRHVVYSPLFDIFYVGLGVLPGTAASFPIDSFLSSSAFRSLLFTCALFYLVNFYIVRLGYLSISISMAWRATGCDSLGLALDSCRSIARRFYAAPLLSHLPGGEEIPLEYYSIICTNYTL